MRPDGRGRSASAAARPGGPVARTRCADSTPRFTRDDGRASSGRSGRSGGGPARRLCDEAFRLGRDLRSRARRLHTRGDVMAARAGPLPSAWTSISRAGARGRYRRPALFVQPALYDRGLPT
ncbi:MAG: hypothetical protein MZU84_06010 [Sphingobacterium sp.]|nr:hypothetical protein [Sphingobacterium sp.]